MMEPGFQRLAGLVGHQIEFARAGKILRQPIQS